MYYIVYINEIAARANTKTDIKKAKKNIRDMYFMKYGKKYKGSFKLEVINND